MKNRMQCMAVAGVFAVFAASAFGQKVGDRVIVVADVELKDGTSVMDRLGRGSTATVLATRNEELQVKGLGEKPGWINRRDVILESQALDFFTDELAKNPQDSMALIHRALAWQARGEPTNAIRDATEAIAIEPDEFHSYLVRGRILQLQEDHEAAISDLTEAIRIAPKDFRSYTLRAVSHVGRNSYDRAIADCTEAIRLNPRVSETYLVRAYVYTAKQDHARAIADYDRSIQLNPHQHSAYYERALLHERARNYDLAIKDYTRGVDLDPKNVVYLNTLAWILATCPSEMHRDGAKAVEYARRACAVDAGMQRANLFDTLAAAHAEAGDFEQATKTQQQALDLAPEAEKDDYLSRLKLYEARRAYRDVGEDAATAISQETAAKIA